jgi:hypothetical protein
MNNQCSTRRYESISISGRMGICSGAVKRYQLKPLCQHGISKKD